MIERMLQRAEGLIDEQAASGPVSLPEQRASGYWDGASLYAVDRNPVSDTGEAPRYGEERGAVYRVSRTDTAARIGGTLVARDGFIVEICPLGAVEPAALWAALPHTAPRPVGALDRTIGTGDRLGLAGQAHAAAFTGRDATPVLAQQSVRELTLTGRTYRDVARAAALGMIESGRTGPYGFDGDHLKDLDEVTAALDAGCTMLTLDLSGFLEPAFAAASGDALERAWERLPAGVQRHWEETYAGLTVPVGEESVRLSDTAVQRATITFHRTIGFVDDVWRAVQARRAGGVDIEISVDETGVDTTLPQHYMLVRELNARGIPITSLAPKFVGEFEKAVDYHGDTTALRREIRRHAELARAMGDYRLSIHSGSDKFSVFPMVESETGGRYHLKTSGTFWLEAIRTLATVRSAVFERVFERAREVFPAMQAHYHLSADLTRVTPPADRDASAYRRYLEEPDARQMLHPSYGAVLEDGALRNAVLAAIDDDRETYLDFVSRHVERHIDALQVPRR